MPTEFASTHPDADLFESGLLDAPRGPGMFAAIDGFAIKRKIGEGGMGLVFLARDPDTGDDVAVKVIKPSLLQHEEVVHRFLVEAGHMEKLSHAHILPVKKISARKEGPYFVTPFIERGSLAQTIERGRPHDVSVVASIAIDIAEALSFAHEKGIIHRDLKPANILVDHQDTAYLADFGLGRNIAVNDSLVNVNRVGYEGTAPYMAPEVARGEAGDGRSDIYSFGATLYEMLSGFPPYLGRDSAQVIAQVLAGPPKPISEKNPNADSGWTLIVEGCMARDLRDRYATMSDVLEDLHRVAGGHKPAGARRVILGNKSLGKGGLILMGCFLLSALIWIIASNSNVGNNSIVHEFTLPGVWIWSGAQNGDFDGDGQLDIFLLRESTVVVISTEGQRLFEHQLYKPERSDFRIVLIQDIDGDQRDEVFVRWSRGDVMVISVITQSGREVKRFEAKGATHGEGDNQRSTMFEHVMIGDIFGDGHQRLVCRSEGGFLRAVHCFDFESTNLLWIFNTAPGITSMIAKDVNGDGRRELIFGSSAPANGHKLADGTDDAHSYVYAVSSKGQLVWRKAMSDVFSTVDPLILNASTAESNQLIVYETRGFDFNQSEFGRVHRLGADGTVSHTYDVKAQILSCTAVTLRQQNSECILVSDRLGKLHVLNEVLETINVVQPAKQSAVDRKLFLKIELVEDLDGDGASEIVASSWEREVLGDLSPSGEGNVRFYHNNKVLILNQNLEVVAEHDLAKRWKSHPGLKVSATKPAKDGTRQLILLSDRVTIWNPRLTDK